MKQLLKNLHNQSTHKQLDEKTSEYFDQLNILVYNSLIGHKIIDTVMTGPIGVDSKGKTLTAQTWKLPIYINETDVQGTAQRIIKEFLKVFKTTNTKINPYVMIFPAGIVKDPKTLKPVHGICTRIGVANE